jgi:hypothetical protein
MLETLLFVAIRRSIADGLPIPSIRDWEGLGTAPFDLLGYMERDQVQDFVDGHLMALGQ